MSTGTRFSLALRAVLWYTIREASPGAGNTVRTTVPYLPGALTSWRGSLLSGVPGSPVDQAETWGVSDAT